MRGELKKRLAILVTPLVALAAMLGLVTFIAGWLILLIPLLIRPQLTKPVTDWLYEKYTKKMIAGIVGTQFKKAAHP